MSEIVREQSEIVHIDESATKSIVALLHRANAYSLTKSAVPTWRYMDKTISHLESEIAKDNCYGLFAADGQPRAVVCVSETDKGVWPDSETADALYFAKLMKDPELAGPEDIKTLLAFVANMAIAQQKSLVRCDAESRMAGLIAYYQQFGFTRRGETPYSSASDRIACLLEAKPESILRHISPEVL